MSSDGDMLAALLAARNSLMDCYWWRRLANPNSPWDQDTAKAHIHFDELPPPSGGEQVHSKAELLSLRPFAIVWADITGGFRWRTDTADWCCAMVSGVMVMQLEINVPSDLANSPSSLATDLHRKLGRIIRTSDPAEPGLLDLSGQDGYLPIIEAKITGYIRTDRKAAVDIGDAVTAEIELHWGVRE